MRTILMAFLLVLFLVAPVWASEAVITFTFDDGSKTVFENGFPVLAKYGFPATFYAITDCVGENPWCVDWNQVAVMSKLGWEIGSHSNSHPHMTKLPDDEIRAELDQSIKTLREHGYKALSYASPYGEFDERVMEFVRKRFRSHRRAWGGGNGFNDRDSVDRYDISPIGLKNTMSFEDVKKLIDRAVKERKWLVFLLHTVVKGEPQEYEFSARTLEKVASYINKKGIKVATISGYLKNEKEGGEK